jgi:RimJ/RimL family protein N-acetyltransferase
VAELLEIRTARLLLRPFRDADRAPLAAMGADPQVMEHLPGTLTPAESDALYERLRAHVERHGFGLWALEVPGHAAFVGWTGLSVPTFAAAFQPCVEVGWRLAREHWGHGYATEAARASLAHGFERLDLAEIVSFTVPENLRSRRVMERLGLRHDPADDFDHPAFPAGHRLSRHVLYRLRREAWRGEGPGC